MSDHCTDRLSDYLDGEMPAGERDALEAHLRECDACAGTLEQLREVVTRARELEDRPPERDLWPGIAARLGEGEGTRVVELGEERRRRRERRRFAFSIPQLAAASVALMLLSGGAVWLALAGSAGPRVGDVAGTGIAATEAGPAPDARFATVRYDAAIAELEGALARHRGALDSTTVAVVERNLETIDRAIAEARRALAEDPASPYLNAHLARAMKRKVELLRRVTVLAGASI